MTSQRDAQDDAPSPDEVRAAVDRLVTSDVFSRSPQLGSFLRFVVEAVLHGNANRIKAYTIGVEVLRRDTRFDPQIDPIVRVEATRLRRAIERYYSGPGAGDPIIIDLPRGSYVPTFQRRQIHGAPSAPLTLRGSWRTWLAGPHRRAAALAAAVVVIGALIGAGLLFASRPGSGPGRTPVRNPAEASRPGNGMPTLAVDKIAVVGPANGSALSPVTLRERMRDAFSRFDAINVVTEATGTASAPAGTAAGAALDPQIDYRLTGSIEHLADTTLTLRFRLVETAGGNVVWTRTFERLFRARDPAAAEETIVVELAMTLLNPFGVVRSRDRVRLASGGGDPRYRCVIVASESLRSFDSDQHARARACLEQLTSIDSGFATGFRYLAAIYLREFEFGSGTSADDKSRLDQALKAARGAVELQPESSRGYNTYASVLFARGQIDQAFAASDRAVALNTYDLAVLGDYGGRLISAGETERGMNMLRRAGGAGVVLPSTHHFYLFLGNYLGGDLPQATFHASQITGEGQPFGLLARALAAISAGDAVDARRAFDQLAALQPAWRDSPRAQLEKFFPAPAIVARLAGDLAAAGLASRP